MNELLLPTDKHLRIVLISLHGLIRGRDPELGRDADTGGQVKYVLELARELGERPEVASVQLITRQIIDERVSTDYAQVEEPLAPKVKICRLPFGPKKYLRKESLWPYLEMFVDQALVHFRRTGIPHVIHGHYADAGLAGAQLARLLHVPYVFTGHSLGRVKKVRMLAAVQEDLPALEKTYRFTARCEAEEVALETAALVITSTHQEVREQYELYEHYQPDRMEVIPPGVDLSQFSPTVCPEQLQRVDSLFQPFLRELHKPPILAMARLDERKNFASLIKTFGESSKLRERANLVLVMGQRDRLDALPKAQKRVLNQVLQLIDDYDLYGQVAYPKQHTSTDAAAFYRWAAHYQGVFINPALTEPFGLTLLEAAASGLPVIATNDGGPIDILGNCSNGLLVDSQNHSEMEHALLRALTEEETWQTWSRAGIEGVAAHYSWSRHVERYLRDVSELVVAAAEENTNAERRPRSLPTFDRLVIADLDNTLDGDDQALSEFIDLLRGSARNIGFCIATGRRLDDVLEWLDSKHLPRPDVIAACVGTELYYGTQLSLDTSWRRHLSAHWYPDKVREILDSITGLTRQDDREQTEFKVSYCVDSELAPSLVKIRKRLREAGLRVNAILSLDSYLDVLPIHGGSDLCLRHLMYRWGFSPEQLLVAGDSGNDEGMLKGRTLGVVVGNHGKELEKLRRHPRIYFAEGCHARGILEGIGYYNFLGDIRIPNDDIPDSIDH